MSWSDQGRESKIVWGSFLKTRGRVGVMGIICAGVCAPLITCLVRWYERI